MCEWSLVLTGTVLINSIQRSSECSTQSVSPDPRHSCGGKRLKRIVKRGRVKVTLLHPRALRPGLSRFGPGCGVVPVAPPIAPPLRLLSLGLRTLVPVGTFGFSASLSLPFRAPGEATEETGGKGVRPLRPGPGPRPCPSSIWSGQWRDSLRHLPCTRCPSPAPAGPGLGLLFCVVVGVSR